MADMIGPGERNGLTLGFTRGLGEMMGSAFRSGHVRLQRLQ